MHENFKRGTIDRRWRYFDREILYGRIEEI